MHQMAEHQVVPELNLMLASRASEAVGFFDKISSQFFDSSLWCVLAPQHRTYAAASTAFAVMARQAVGMFYQFFTRRSTYPWKLWLLLTRPEIANEIHKSPWCMRDDFTQGFLLKYDTLEKLQSDGCRSALVAMASILRVDTYPIENRFGWMRRFKGVVTTTHEDELRNTSAHFVHTRQRLIEGNWLVKSVAPETGKVTKQDLQSVSARKPILSFVESSPLKKRHLCITIDNLAQDMNRLRCVCALVLVKVRYRLQQLGYQLLLALIGVCIRIVRLLYMGAHVVVFVQVCVRPGLHL